MRERTRKLAWMAMVVLATCLFLFAASTALAQAAAGIGTAPVMVMKVSATTVIIAVLSVVVGFVAQAISTGSFLGVIPLPPGWIPYVTLFGTFLTAFVASITTATTDNESAWINAFLAGFMALTGAVGGITAHQHISAPKLARAAAAANDNGTEATTTPAS